MGIKDGCWVMESDVCSRSIDDEQSLVLDYAYYGDENPEKIAKATAVEQSIEFPFELVTHPAIADNIVPRLVRMEAASKPARFSLSFNPEITGYEIPQLLNVLFGNISMLDNIRLEDVHFPASLLSKWGPAFGVEGIRRLTGKYTGPLVCGALKPMGLTTKTLADAAKNFVIAGVDCIKDDHGIADQSFGRFKERVLKCSEAVREACIKFDRKTLYVPNISGPVDALMERAHFAKEAGAGGLMVAPGLMGFDAIRCLREDPALRMPIFAHPSLLGSLALNPHQGMAFRLVFGLLPRLAGADASIFPNHGGRFRFSVEDCHDIARGCLETLGTLSPILPSPAGGMRVGSVSSIIDDYGTENVMVLIGGDLYRRLPISERISF